MAVSDRTNADPIFNNFVWFYDEKNYADKTIQEALDSSNEKWGSSAQTRAHVIALTSMSQIVYLQTIGKLNDGNALCNATSSENGGITNVATQATIRHPIDEAAALIVGSMEGYVDGGSPDLGDGQLVWNFANRNAQQFGTTNAHGYAQVNAEIQELLFAAKAELYALDCESLSRITSRIESLIVVGIMQGILSVAIHGDSHKQRRASESSSGVEDNDVRLAEGKVLTRAILPILADRTPSAAVPLQKAMLLEHQPGAQYYSSNHARPQIVADALGFALGAGLDLPCTYLGETPEANPCLNNKHLSSATARFAPRIVMAMVLGAWIAKNTY